MVEISERQQAILKAVVEEYVITAAPVSSERIAGRVGLKVSSATVRNEMVELEEMGLLSHPHTSAGRMPTDHGYRFFLEKLMTLSVLTPTERRTVWHQFHQIESEVDEWGPLAAAVIARMARSASLVTKLHARETRLKRVELVSIQDDQALVVVILRSGGLQQRLLRLDHSVRREELARIANKLSDLLADRSCAQVARAISVLVGAEQEIGQVVARMLDQSQRNWSDAVFYEGIGFISAEPEFGRTQQFMDLMDVLQRGGPLAPLVSQVLESGGLRVVIGRENEVEQMRSCSVILTRYGQSSEAAGVVGVVGPTRMRYWRAVSLVRFMAELLDHLVEQSLR